MEREGKEKRKREKKRLKMERKKHETSCCGYKKLKWKKLKTDKPQKKDK